ncbi:MAG: ankyrin repeat domain-containing protein [Planctomycetota bacterium]|nr:MAG: ankyrin repeat domain-containing protein [Planctomycetota bacterium]
MAQSQNWSALLERVQPGTSVQAASPDGTTALHWAVYYDQPSVVERLIDAGADVQAANRYGVRPLSIACQNGNTAIVKMLLEAGADPDTALPGGETALMTAARTGVPGPVQLLIEHGADVGATERKGQTALMWAAAEGNVEAVDLLLKAGADPRRKLKSGFTPYFFAVREGRQAVVQRFLLAGIDPNETMAPERKTNGGPKEGMSGLILATLNGHLELALELVRAGADPNDKRVGYTALHAITWVRKPLRGDGDPPPQGSGKVTSLDFVRQMVAAGADVNARHGKAAAGNLRLNKTGATPFLLAAETGDLPLLKLLLELGADPHLQNVDHCTPLLAAAGVGVLGNGDESAGTEEEAIATVQMMLDLGLDINAVDDNGNTAMHGAAFKSWVHLVHYLAQHGADIRVWNRPNVRGWTPLDIARGHRPGNFRPSPETIVAIESVMRSAGVEPSAQKP